MPATDYGQEFAGRARLVAGQLVERHRRFVRDGVEEPRQADSPVQPGLVVPPRRIAGLGSFPGIWPVSGWPQYWKLQYSWNNGHQPWQADPAMVVQAWARSRWGGTPVVRKMGANTFKVTGPGGQVYIVAGARPVTVPGPWVITTVTTGSV